MKRNTKQALEYLNSKLDNPRTMYWLRAKVVRRELVPDSRTMTKTHIENQYDQTTLDAFVDQYKAKGADKPAPGSEGGVGWGSAIAPIGLFGRKDEEQS